MGLVDLLCFLVCMLISISLTAGQDQKCYNTGNFTSNSTYGRNRDFILSSLASNVSGNSGFYNATFGRDPDKVYALALCRGDTSSEECASCVQAATQDIMKACPNQKEAISWGAGPSCLVHCANRSFFGKLELDPVSPLYNVNNITSNLTQFDIIWESLMDRVARKASQGSSRLKYATEEANITFFQKIYALMQCTPDISQSDCHFCLHRSVAEYQNCCHGSQGGVVQRPSCIFRWDLYPFYDLTAADPSPSPPPGPSTNNEGMCTSYPS